MNCLKEPSLWLFPEPIWHREIEPIFHVPPCFLSLPVLSGVDKQVLVKSSLFCTAFALSLQWDTGSIHCFVLLLTKKCRGAVGNTEKGFSALLALYQSQNYVAFLFSPSAKIVRAHSKTWDLSTTGF